MDNSNAIKILRDLQYRIESSDETDSLSSRCISMQRNALTECCARLAGILKATTIC